MTGKLGLVFFVLHDIIGRSTEMKEYIMNQNHLALITELRHQLHAHPELSLQESDTRQFLMEFIKKHTTLEVVDRGSWFYAYYQGRRETENRESKTTAACGPIAFRADFDALPMEESIDLPYASEHPGVAHKCGHDGHSAALAGLALELAGTEQEEGSESLFRPKRDVYLIFQHAEEIGAGGETCAQLIAEKGISEVYAFHNWSGFPEQSVIVRSGTIQCASKGLTICMEGTPAHASEPENGINPAAALSDLVLAVKDEVEEPGYAGMVMATVVNVAIGSRNFGIAAYQGEVSMTLRAQYEHDMMMLEEEIRDHARHLAEVEGLKLSFEESDVFPETVNAPEAVEKVRRAAEQQGLRVIDLEKPIRGSEDFGYYLKQCPGAIFYIGNGEEYPQLHTCGFDFNDRILETAVDLFERMIGDSSTL